MSEASVPPPGWVAPERAAIPCSDGDFAASIAGESRRKLDRKRVEAKLIDRILCAPVYLVAAWKWDPGRAWLLYVLAFMVVEHLCEVTMGATIGKRQMRIRVARKEDGALPTPFQSSTRAVIGLVEYNPIGLIALHRSKGRTRIGDLAAGTIVVDATLHPIPARAPAPVAFLYPVLWSLPVLLVCLAMASGDLPGSYRYEADKLCTQSAAAAPAGGERAFDAYVRYQRLGYALSQLNPPKGWRARHDDLMVRLEHLLRSLEGGPRTTDDVSFQMPELSGLTPAQEITVDHAALHAEGYHACFS